MATLSKMAKKSDEAEEEACYINLLNDDLLGRIFSRLPTASFIANSALACKPWCQIIADRDILRRRHPQFLSLCGVFLEVDPIGKRCSQSFVRADHMAVTKPEGGGTAPEAGNNAVVVQAMPNGHWTIVDSLDDVLLLRRRDSGCAVHTLVIYHPSTGDLTELPPVPVSTGVCSCCVGAGMLRDGAGSGAGRVVCVVTEFKPGNRSGRGRGRRCECSSCTWVFSFGSGSWEPLSCNGDPPGRCSFPHRAGDALISSLRSPARSIEASYGMMLSMHTGRTFDVCLPNWEYDEDDDEPRPPEGFAFVDDDAAGGDGKADDDAGGTSRRLWLVTMDDNKLVLSLYSHTEPEKEHVYRSEYICVNWVKEKEADLRRQVEEFVGVGGLEQCRPKNVQSRNGYVFFKTEEHGYFAVHLQNMQVQRLSGVDRSYMGCIYPYMYSTYVHEP